MALLTYVGKNVFTFNCKGIDPVRLLPGVNEIADKSLESMKAHPLFNSLVKNGKLTILSDNKVLTDGKRSIAEMLEYIPKVLDSKTLKKIIESDGRPQVVVAAKEQLDSLKGKKEDKQGDVEHFR